jgi:hypothetical protein
MNAKSGTNSPSPAPVIKRRDNRLIEFRFFRFQALKTARQKRLSLTPMAFVWPHT